jgi:hypothetical protein
MQTTANQPESNCNDKMNPLESSQAGRLMLMKAAKTAPDMKKPCKAVILELPCHSWHSGLDLVYILSNGVQSINFEFFFKRDKAFYQ